MKRLYIAALAGLCAAGPAGAQDAGLAPTAPTVPPPVLQPGAGAGSARNLWSPLRSPVAPDAGYVVPAGACGPAGCAPDNRACWERVKAWLCFNYSPSGLPKMRPAPYVTPIQGLFGCSSGSGCATPCGAGGGAAGGNYPVQPPPVIPAPPQMPAPARPAGTGLMPPRGSGGAAVAAPTTWTTPPAVVPASEFGTARPPARW